MKGFSTGVRAQIDLPAPADRIFAGDFNADDHVDVAAIKIGTSQIYWAEGNGKGSLGSFHALTLNGPITAVASGEMNRADLLPDLVVAINGESGPQILVFESPLGVPAQDPEILSVKKPRDIAGDRPTG